MTISPKLTTAAACRVAGLDRDRFNEAVAADFFTCAPKTSPGRARLFDHDDMIALRLYRENLDDGFSKEMAGTIACSVAQAARANPNAKTITYVQSYFSGAGDSYPSDAVPNAETWDDVLFSGTDIRKVSTFNIGKMRKMLAHYTEEERAIIGEAD